MSGTENRVHVNDPTPENRFDIDILICPNCEAQNFNIDNIELDCGSCGHRYPIRDGIPILLVDQQARTKLEDVDYDQIHRINPKSSANLYSAWNEVFNMYDIRYNNLLELGSGTGFLTYGLLSSSPFHNIHITDISYKFLKILLDRMPKSNISQYYYVCDANQLPFMKSHFDIIVGNSILHHILDYQITLEKCYELLGENGIAIFTEPVRDGHVILAFFNALMRELHLNTDLKIFTDKELKGLKRMSMNATKHLRLTREQLIEKEDKYIFNIKEMKELAKTIGFKNMTHYNMGKPVGSAPGWGYKEYLIHRMARHGIPKDKIDRFDFLFSAFGKTFSDGLGDQLVTPFGFFVFEK